MSDFGEGFRTGLMEAVHTLRQASDQHRADSRASKKVLDAQANEMAAAILGAWANGLEINANRLKIPDNDKMRVALDCARRFLRNQDGAGFGTTKMEGSEFFMWASTIASQIDDALADDQPAVLCEDCPLVGHSTDITRCLPCPRRSIASNGEDAQS